MNSERAHRARLARCPQTLHFHLSQCTLSSRNKPSANPAGPWPGPPSARSDAKRSSMASPLPARRWYALQTARRVSYSCIELSAYLTQGKRFRPRSERADMTADQAGLALGTHRRAALPRRSCSSKKSSLLGCARLRPDLGPSGPKAAAMSSGSLTLLLPAPPIPPAALRTASYCESLVAGPLITNQLLIISALALHSSACVVQFLLANPKLASTACSAATCPCVCNLHHHCAAPEAAELPVGHADSQDHEHWPHVGLPVGPPQRLPAWEVALVEGCHVGRHS